MEIIVHAIRLHPGTDPAEFEAWVRNVDYATCPELPSVLAFDVLRVSGEDAGRYAEVIRVSSVPEFERDMRTEAFQRLVADFSKMAAVIDETAGERLEPGYART
ncbi:REDY-like protein HapK [Actinomadura pelletieri DSM 43383]|uniref:REDY-like protein HapK n=1 Tax=Actinomadura pelletieri DSM 43383 TaxID=1120940 RepID=A0A495QZL1_9ACTN|nr:RedY protein [Actinomadura pelletieri]RKS79665.1 REDY-like protein HapK [Actinomadura pelletieri DSM 43383]